MPTVSIPLIITDTEMKSCSPSLHRTRVCGDRLVMIQMASSPVLERHFYFIF